MKTTFDNLSRRDVLKLSLKTAASAGILSSVGHVPLASAADGDFKALVCVFLYGGNDSFNMLIPRSQGEYSEYESSRRNFAIPKASLLTLNGQDFFGREYGVNPNTPEIQQLYNNGKLAFVSNIGPLLEPVTRDSFGNNSVLLPPHLFSHSDQQSHWMTADPLNASPIGWAGRYADRYPNINSASIVPLNFSIGASNIWQSGIDSNPLILDEGGLSPQHEFWGGELAESMRKRLTQLMQQNSSSKNELVKEYERIYSRGDLLTAELRSVLKIAPNVSTAFPNTSLGKKLGTTLSLINSHKELGMGRQVYFVGMSGWDTHDLQSRNHPRLLKSLSESLGAFQSALDELNLSDSVTTYTASDFGRTLTSNGDGTDHGWAGNQIVMGGAVNGGQVYGDYPTLVVDGPDDADFGRMIPTLAAEQLASTLALWMDIPAGDLNSLFPNLDRFSTNDLGFMKA